MFKYNVCNVYDEEIFNKQCLAIEKHISDLKKDNLLNDVDGTQIQIYTFIDNKHIKVINDIDFGISVVSDIDIKDYFL